MPGQLQVLFYQLPDKARGELLEALHRADYIPVWCVAQTTDDLEDMLTSTTEVILAPMGATDQGARQVQDFVHARRLSLPVIALTNNASPEDITKCLQHGIADCLDLKDLDSLGSILLKALRLQQVYRDKRLAEEALNAKNYLLDQVMNTTPSGILMFNSEGKIIFANERAQKIFRLTHSEITQRSYDAPEWQITSLDGSPFPSEQLPFQRVLATGLSASEVRYTIQLPGEKRICVSINAAPIRSKTGKLEFVVAAVEDITAQLEDQVQLRREHDRTQQYLDVIEVILVALNADGEITLINSKGCSLLEYSENELLGKNWFDAFIPEDVREGVRSTFFKLMSGDVEHVKYFENTVLTHSGAIRVIAWHNTLLRNDRSEIIGTLSSGVDITEQIAASEARLQSEERYRKLVEFSPEAIAVHSQGCFVYINPAGVRLLGAKSPEDLLGRSVMEIIHPEYHRFVLDRVQRYPTSPEALPLIEAKFIRLDGSIIDVEVASMPFTFEGHPAAQMIARDITSRKQSERAIQAILKGTADVGAEFFRSLVLELASVLQVRYALVGLLITSEPPRIRTVARCLDGRIVDNIEYDLKNTPCEKVVGKSACFYPTGVQKAFPNDHGLVELGAECYLGMPLFSTAGTPLGHIAVINNQPMFENDLAKNLLTIFAARAGAELERMQAEEKYRSIIESVSEGIFQTTPDGRFLMANTSLAHLLGYESPAELIAHVNDIPLQLYVEPESRFVWQEALKKNAVIQGYEVQLYHRDGTKFWVSENIHAVMDDNGELLFYEGTVTDITGRRMAEEIISQNTAHTRTLDVVSRALAEAGLDYHATLNTIARSIAEIIGDLCVVNLISSNGIFLDASAVHHPDPEIVAEAMRLRLQDPQQVNEGIAGLVLQKGESIIAGTNSPETRRVAKPDYLAFAEKYGFHSALAAPIRAQGQTYGVLVVYRGRSKPEFESDDLLFFEELAHRAALAITNARLLTETERRLRYVQALRDIDVAITSSLELSVTLNVVLEHVTSQLGTDAAAILLLNPHLQTLQFAAGRGFRTNVIQRTRLQLGESYAGRAALERQTIGIPDLGNDPNGAPLKEKFSGEDFCAFYGTPLLAKGQVKGVLEIFHRSRLEPDEEWLNYLEMLARQAAIAIDNSSLFQELQRSNAELILAYDATIEGWSRALDLRDKETEGHTQRVTQITEQLAKRMGVTDAQMVHVRRGALLHDIGKMGVPDRVLLKSTELSEEEWEVMHKHPQYAFEMLLPIAHLRPALDIPYSHHERWDGLGYPRRLKGEQIPLAARIFAVVDVWDALTSDRPYRPAWSKAKALEHIKNNRGTMFDPRVVDEFIKLLAEIPGV